MVYMISGRQLLLYLSTTYFSVKSSKIITTRTTMSMFRETNLEEQPNSIY